MKEDWVITHHSKNEEVLNDYLCNAMLKLGLRIPTALMLIVRQMKILLWMQYVNNKINLAPKLKILKHLKKTRNQQNISFIGQIHNPQKKMKENFDLFSSFLLSFVNVEINLTTFTLVLKSSVVIAVQGKDLHYQQSLYRPVIFLSIQPVIWKYTLNQIVTYFDKKVSKCQAGFWKGFLIHTAAS